MSRVALYPKGMILAVSFFLLSFMTPAVTNAFAEQAGAEALQASGGLPFSSKRAINEAQINNFAKLQITLDKISEQYAGRVSDDVEAGSDMDDEVSKKMLEAISEHDLTIAEYHRIAGAVIVDEETHQRVVSKLKDLRGTAN